MKLTQEARAYINTVLSTSASGNEEVRVALAYAMACGYVKDQIDKNNESSNPTEFRNRSLRDLNEINKLVVLRFDLDDTIQLVRSFYNWRCSVGAIQVHTPKSFENVEYPLAGILGLSGHIQNDVIKTLCHPMVPKYLAGWNSVLACK